MSRLVCCCLAVVAIALSMAFWHERQGAASRRLAAWEARQRDEQQLDALQRIVEVSGQEMTVAEFAALVERATGQPVTLDDDALAEAGIQPYFQPVQLPEGAFSGRALLDFVLGQCELCYSVHRGRCEITTSKHVEAPSALVLNVYPAPQPGLTASSTEEEWRDLILATVAPDTWDDVGGVGHIEAVPGGLAVVQTRDIHEAVRSIFVRLGEMESPPRSWASVPLVPASSSAAELRIKQQLDRAASIDVFAEPLHSLLANFAREHDFPAVLDIKHLEEAAVGSQTPVTLRLSNVSVRSVLSAVAHYLELAWVIRNEMVVLTTIQEAESELDTIAYPVHDLVATPHGPDFTSLINLITVTIAPDSWDEVGGPGTISGISRGWLVVSQTDAIHAELEPVLTQIRRALNESGSKPYPLGRQTTADLRIEEALEEEIAFDYLDAALADVCDDLSEQLGINVRLNEKRLEESGLDFDTVIRCNFPRAALRVQLRRLCDALEMEFVARNEVLWITTAEDVEDEMTTRIYDVRPLIDPDIGLTDQDSLVELLTDHVEPESWDQVGGPGAVEHFRGLVVISQTPEIQRLVAGLLAQLETSCLPDGLEDRSAQRSAYLPADDADAGIEDALSRPIDLALQEVSLQAAMRQLSGQTGVPITIDFQELDNADMRQRKLFSVAMHGRPLGDSLEHLLHPLEMQFTIRNHELVVTHPQRSQELRLTRVYRVTDCTRSLSSTSELLREQIESELDQEYWDTHGGFGCIRGIGKDFLIVSADFLHHRQLQTWLGGQTRRPVGAADNEQADVQQTLLPADFALADPLTEEPLHRVLLSGSSRLSVGDRPPPPAIAPRPEDDPFATHSDPFASQP